MFKEIINWSIRYFVMMSIELILMASCCGRL